MRKQNKLNVNLKYKLGLETELELIAFSEGKTKCTEISPYSRLLAECFILVGVAMFSATFNLVTRIRLS